MSRAKDEVRSGNNKNPGSIVIIDLELLNLLVVTTEHIK